MDDQKRREYIKYIVEENKNCIDSKILKELLYKWLETKEFDVRNFSKSNDKKIEKSNLTYTEEEENKIDLIWECILDLKVVFEDWNQKENLKDFYQRKRFKRGFDFSSNEIQEFIKLNKSDIENPELCSNKVRKIIKNMLESVDLYKEHIGENSTSHVFGDFFDLKNVDEYEYRIYINMPQTNDTQKFLYEYIRECAKRRIPYDMKGFNYDLDSKDKTVLYITKDNLVENIDALKSAAERYPEIVDKSGNPVCLTGKIPLEISEKLNKFCGFSHKGNPQNSQTYNDVMDRNLELALVKTFVDFSSDVLKYMKKRNLDVESLKNLRDIKIVRRIGKQIQFGSTRDSEFYSCLIEFINNEFGNSFNDINTEEFIQYFGNNLQLMSAIREMEENDVDKIKNIPICISKSMYEEYMSIIEYPSPKEKRGIFIGQKLKVGEGYLPSERVHIPDYMRGNNLPAKNKSQGKGFFRPPKPDDLEQ